MMKVLDNSNKKISEWRLRRHHFASWKEQKKGDNRVSWFKRTKRYDFKGVHTLMFQEFYLLSPLDSFKSILNPHEVVWIGSHYALKCLTKHCYAKVVSRSVAKLHHYRNACTLGRCKVTFIINNIQFVLIVIF